jgi:alkanesulfonate monooxygenase SsuD/methylene tetrahydromethanopterin reductase-like flavin-dependent oxidoreductase (luciferase family)
MPERFRYGIFEAWTTLSAIASVTSHARLTNVVLCNLFRNPALLAKMASTLDVISNGRVNLALGAGWFKGECTAYGIPWKPYKTRVGMLKESLQLTKRLWTEEQVDFTGKYYQIQKGILSPKPLQKPHPPILVGGSSESVMKIAVEEADGWDVDTGPCTLDLFQERVKQLRAYCKERSRDPNTIRVSVNTTPIFADSVQEARKLATNWAQRIGKDPEEYMANKSVLLGTADDILAAAEGWFSAGANQVSFLMPHDGAYAERLCEGIARINH